MSAKSDDTSLDLVALAIQEQFLEEWRAGQRPRLSVYAHRYPAYAAALAELVASLPPDTQLDEGSDTSLPEPLWMGDGIPHALRAIFGDVAPSHDEERLPRVAEERSPYQAGQRADDPPDTSGAPPQRD